MLRAIPESTSCNYRGTLSDIDLAIMCSSKESKEAINIVLSDVGLANKKDENNEIIFINKSDKAEAM